MNEQWQIPQMQRTDFLLKKSKWAVLIPVLNEGERIRGQLKRMQSSIHLVDILIVDGGSTDQALDHGYLRSCNVRSLLVNQGQPGLGSQLRVGLSAVLNDGYEGVILIDGNDKDNSSAVPRFIEKLSEGFDHIQGSRFISGGVHKNTPWLRWFAVRFVHAPLLSLASHSWVTDTTNGFRAYSRKFLLDSRVQPFRNVFIKYELHYYLTLQSARLGFRCVEIPVERSYPLHSEIPTKIKGLQGYRSVLKALFNTCLGKYKP